jgi:hypothetical protein
VLFLYPCIPVLVLYIFEFVSTGETNTLLAEFVLSGESNTLLADFNSAEQTNTSL